VTVDAPIGKSMNAVVERVKRRAAWIVKQRRYFDRFQPLPPEKRYVTGETFLYLGRQYRLKVVERKSESVKMRGRFIWVRTPDRNARGRIKKLVQGWYTDHALALFAARLEACHAMVKRHDIPYPELRLRCMKRRWGSCAKSGDILLNTHLIQAPRHCVDYVITHELCHLKYPHHGNGFCRLLSHVMPDWERRKGRLEQVLF